MLTSAMLHYTLLSFIVGRKTTINQYISVIMGRRIHNQTTETQETLSQKQLKGFVDFCFSTTPEDFQVFISYII